MGQAPTLLDVARCAGVSTATVSRVINDSTHVSHDVRARVNKALDKLKYRPNRAARRLRVKNGIHQLIGLLIPDIQNPFYVDVIRGVEEVVYSNDYAVFICNFSQDFNKEKAYLNIMKEEGVDGLIVAPYHEEDKMVASLVRKGLPIVCVDRGLSQLDVDLVVVDNEAGAYQAVKHLIQLGHNRIGYVGGLYTIPTSRHRRDGYIKALREFDIEIDDSLIKFGDSRHESGQQMVREFLDMQDPPTALLTGNNVITLGGLEVIHSRGVKIPEEIAVVGFDDMYWSNSLNPPLTAVRQSGFDIGKQATTMLFERLSDPERMPRKVQLNTELIIRKSCGADILISNNQ